MRRLVTPHNRSPVATVNHFLDGGHIILARRLNQIFRDDVKPLDFSVLGRSVYGKHDRFAKWLVEAAAGFAFNTSHLQNPL